MFPFFIAKHPDNTQQQYNQLFNEWLNVW